MNKILYLASTDNLYNTISQISSSIAHSNDIRDLSLLKEGLCIIDDSIINANKIIDFSEVNKNVKIIYLSFDLLDNVNSSNICVLYKPIILDKLYQQIPKKLLKAAVYSDFMKIGHLQFYFNKRIIQLDREIVNLTEKEAELIKYLYENNTATREELLTHVWCYNPEIDTHTIDTHIYRIRKKLGTELIITTDHGYKLIK